MAYNGLLSGKPSYDSLRLTGSQWRPTHLRWLKDAMQFLVIGHPIEVPLEACSGDFMTGGGGVISLING